MRCVLERMLQITEEMHRVLNPQGLHFQTNGREEWEDTSTGLAAEESTIVSSM